MSRALPNILISGTPGTGKTSLCDALCSSSNGLLKHVNIGDLVKEKKLYIEFDEDMQTYIQNDDAICDELEDQMNAGGNVVDTHTVDYFPERWFDLVIVLRASTESVYDRLSARGYHQAKIDENVQSEILQVCLDEANDSYKTEVVWELKSDTVEEMEQNLEKIQQWLGEWTGKA